MNPQTPEDGEAFAAITRIVEQRDALRDTLQNAIACLVVCADDLEMADLPHEAVRTDIADYQAVLETCCPVKPSASASSLTRHGAS